MRQCPMCNGVLCETDNEGTEECEKCGTTFRLLAMERNKDESKQ